MGSTRTDPITVDCSHWQESTGGSPWEKLRSVGINGVILKCTEGTGYVDPTFKERYAAALENEFLVATYHFLRPGSIDTQMNFYLDTLDPVDGERVIIDHEDESVSLDELRQAVQSILDRNPSLQITIYSGHLIKEQLGDNCDEFLRDTTSLWIAHYTGANSPTWPSRTWPVWALWQYSDKGTVAGYGPIDVNRFNGEDESFLRWMGPMGAEPAPPPRPIDKPMMTLTVNADRPVRLAIFAGPFVEIVKPE